MITDPAGAGQEPTAGIGEVLRCLKDEYLLHPGSGFPSGLSVIRTLLGVRPSGIHLPDGLQEELESSDHLVFVLIDGMGMNILERLPENSILRTSFRTELRSVYPSTTASALVSYASASWPAEHAVVGWDTYIPDRNLTATVLPFIERTTRRRLDDFSTSIADVFAVESRLNEMPRSVRIFQPEKIATGEFSEWFAGGIPRVPFRNLREALHLIELLMDDHSGSGDRSFTYLYIPFLDTTEHRWGPHHDSVFLELLGLDRLLALLSASVSGRARICVTADHGQVYVPPERQYDLSEARELLQFLEFPPTGEARNPIFHVLPGKEKAFEERFMEMTHGDFTLIRPEEAGNLSLFGPGELPEETRRRLGTFIGIALSPAAVLYFPSPAHRYVHLGFHGGLSAEEMRIPLVLI